VEKSSDDPQKTTTTTQDDYHSKKHHNDEASGCEGALRSILICCCHGVQHAMMIHYCHLLYTMHSMIYGDGDDE